MEGIDGLRVVVTGSSRGIRRAAAVRLGALGARVVINGTQANALAETAAALEAVGAEYRMVTGSVAEPATAQALIDSAVSAFGAVDAVVNNAGIVRDRTLLKMSLEEWDDVIAVHLRGAFLVTQAAARAMKESGGGHILQVVSNSGLAGGFGQANYAAAKAGMMGLLRTCVLELARLNIRTNALWPIAETDMTQVVFDRASEAAAKAGAEPPSPASLGFGSTEAVAEGLAWLPSSHAKGLNGQCLTFNGRKAAFWSHPQECFEVFSEDPMNGEALTKWLGSTAPQPSPVQRWSPRAFRPYSRQKGQRRLGGITMAAPMPKHLHLRGNHAPIRMESTAPTVLFMARSRRSSEGPFTVTVPIPSLPARDASLVRR